MGFQASILLCRCFIFFIIGLCLRAGGLLGFFVFGIGLGLVF
ncbi:hypothetical protein GP5015_491 [gamma proteobacterium HTCC5015]|nr:hypothetical protein GP5015_491 [gamma proteobacterium HTCC5015]